MHLEKDELYLDKDELNAINFRFPKDQHFESPIPIEATEHLTYRVQQQLRFVDLDPSPLPAGSARNKLLNDQSKMRHFLPTLNSLGLELIHLSAVELIEDIQAFLKDV